MNKHIFVILIAALIAGCGGGGNDNNTVNTNISTNENGSVTSPFIESTLLASGTLNPNGYVKSTNSGSIYDLSLGTFGAALFLSSNDNVTFSIQSQGAANYRFTQNNGLITNYSISDPFSINQAINVSTLANQNTWINQAVLASWASGLNGANIDVAIIDDFTANNFSDFNNINLPVPSCSNVMIGNTTKRYCPSANKVVYSMTHGEQVSLILSGTNTSANLLYKSIGPYANSATPTTIAGTLLITQPVTVSSSSPVYGVAYGAKSTTKRGDYLDYQKNTNGLFNQLQIWGSGSGTTSINYQKTKVVNLSLGGTSANPITNNISYINQLSYANASTVPDAVFVKSAGNESCVISQLNCDYDNATFYNSGKYKDKTLIVGALNVAGGTIASYSNRAGSYSDRFVVADGRGILRTDGAYDQGTSFAAPRVSGYVAILRQKYPNLSAADAASIILATAKWNPAWGPKNAANQAIYGQGEVDLDRALNVIGYLP